MIQSPASYIVLQKGCSMADRVEALPTIYDVAREAGVSPMTVSRVFNSSGPVSAQKREAVMRSAEKLRYIPNRSAQLLASADPGRTSRSRARQQRHLALPRDCKPVDGDRIGLAVLRCFRRNRVVPIEQLQDCLKSEGLNAAKAASYLSAVGLVRFDGDHVIVSERGQGVLAEIAERLADIADLLVAADKNSRRKFKTTSLSE